MPVIAFSPRKAATVLYGVTGFGEATVTACKPWQAFDRQGLPLHQETLRCGPTHVGGPDRQISSRKAREREHRGSTNVIVLTPINSPNGERVQVETS
jgi:hypothetical protein